MNTELNQDAMARELLRGLKVVVGADTFTLVSLKRDDFASLLQNSNISPAGDAPYMILWDQHEVTLMLNQLDFASVSGAIPEAKIEEGFRLLTFDAAMDFGIVGFLAEVSRILAKEGIAILAISAFSRDHILVRQDKLAQALKALGQYVADLC